MVLSDELFSTISQTARYPESRQKFCRYFIKILLGRSAHEITSAPSGTRTVINQSVSCPPPAEIHCLTDTLIARARRSVSPSAAAARSSCWDFLAATSADKSLRRALPRLPNHRHSRAGCHIDDHSIRHGTLGRRFLHDSAGRRERPHSELSPPSLIQLSGYFSEKRAD